MLPELNFISLGKLFLTLQSGLVVSWVCSLYAFCQVDQAKLSVPSLGKACLVASADSSAYAKKTDEGVLHSRSFNNLFQPVSNHRLLIYYYSFCQALGHHNWFIKPGSCLIKPGSSRTTNKPLPWGLKGSLTNDVTWENKGQKGFWELLLCLMGMSQTLLLSILMLQNH